MAQKVRLIRLAWENGVGFKMDTKLDEGAYTTVIEIEENGHIKDLWESGIEIVCTKYFEKELDSIGSEMKS